MRFITSIFLLLIVSISTEAHAQATNTQLTDAQVFIDDLANQAFDVLNDVSLTQEEREDAFRVLLSEGFDMDYIGRLVLGRHNRTATPEQLSEYRKIFPEYVLRVYSRRLTEFGDEQFEVRTAAPAGRRDIFVRSVIIRPGGPEPVNADWRVRPQETDGSNGTSTYKIIDLKVEGISMVISQRDEFQGKIAQDGMEGLLASLRDGVERGSSELAAE